MPFPITGCISLMANIWLSSSFISIRPLVCFSVAHIYLCGIDEKAKQAAIRYGLNSPASTFKRHYFNKRDNFLYTAPFCVAHSLIWAMP